VRKSQLLIVDDSCGSDVFKQKYNSALYNNWDIVICNSSRKINNFECNNLSVEETIKQKYTEYKTLFVMRSRDYFVKPYNLDLLADVLDFPTLDEHSHVNFENKTQQTITLGRIANIYHKVIRCSIFENEDWLQKELSYQYVNFLFLVKRQFVYKVDYVFPYVNNLDPVWIADYLFYKKSEGERIESENQKDSRYESNYSTGLQRFRDAGLLKYAFRSIEKNLPFVNKVHMIVSSKSQVPDWVNQDTVDIITHDEFMPKELLPCFSSSEFEMFLPFLPRVSEYFIYGNDDTFFTKRQRLQDWFFEGKPVTQCIIRPTQPDFTGDPFRHNDLMVVKPADMTFEVESCLGQQHCQQPYVLSKMKECFRKHEKQILASCTRFRENNKNLNQSLFLGYNYFNNFLYQKRRRLLTTSINKWQSDFKLSNYSCVCVNDSEEDMDVNKLLLVCSLFEKEFGKRSIYEV
jgi:hypothetical protein